MTLGGVATGLLVESHEGRPTKIEGNPLHPGSLGATDVFAQAAILGLYDPDRSQTLTNLGEIRPWSAFLGAMRAGADGAAAAQGRGPPHPDRDGQLADAGRADSRPARSASRRRSGISGIRPSRDNAARGREARVRRVRRRAVPTSTRPTSSSSLDADFLGCGPGASALRARVRRRGGVPKHAERMNRLYAVETMPTSTGARADHRLPLRPSEIEAFAARARRRASACAGARSGAARAGRRHAPQWIDADRQGSAGASRREPRHRRRTRSRRRARARARDERRRSATSARRSSTRRPVEAEPVDQLAVAPRSRRRHERRPGRRCSSSSAATRSTPRRPICRSPTRMDKVQLRVHLSLYDDETSALCHWQIPEAHFLEAWSDARAYDGTASIVQPLIAPLYGGRSAHEVLAAMSDRPERSGLRHRARVLDDGQRQRNGADADFEAAWRRWLHDGVIPDTALRREHGRRSTAGRGRAAARPPAGRDGRASRSPSGTIRRSSTAASPTTAGCRSCRSRSRSSPGTTPCSSARRPPRRLQASASRRRSAAASTGRSSATSSSSRIGGRTVRGAAVRRSPAIPTTASPCISATAARARGHVGDRRRLQRQRAAHRPTRCGSAAALEIVDDRRARIRSRARSITT